MSVHLLLPMATMALNLVLLVVVFTRPVRVPGRPAFAMFLLTMAGWAGTQLAMDLSTSAASAAAWHRLLLVNAVLFPTLYLHFTYDFAGREPNRPILLGAYLASATGIVLTLSGLMVRELAPTSHGFVPHVSIYFAVLMPFLYAAGLIAIANVIHTQRHAPSAALRNRASYLLVGTVVSMLAGTGDLVAVLGFTDVLMSSAGNFVFGLLATAALLSDRMLDARRALRRLATQLVLALLAGGFATLAIMSGSALLGTSPSVPLAAALVIAIYASVSPILHRRVRDQVDRLWYRDRLRPLRAGAIRRRGARYARPPAPERHAGVRGT